jgi:hypothetical protein
MEKIKFWNWFFTFSNISIITFYLFFTITILYRFDEFDPKIFGYLILGLIQSMGVIFIFKTIQHWRDIKKGISR